MQQLARLLVARRPVAGAVFAALLLACAPRAEAQEWTAYTSMREVNALTTSPEAIWAATEGGVFSFAPATGVFQQYTAVSGLNNVGTQAITYDTRRGAVWIGYSDGALDRLELETGTIRTFFDIARNERFPDKTINRLVVHGDSLLIATDFGLVVFDPIRGEVRDTYTQFGALPSPTPVRDVIVAPVPEGGDGFWLAATGGVVHAPLSTSNLQEPGAWTVEATGLPLAQQTTNSIGTAIAAFNGRIYVGTEGGLAAREADGTYTPSLTTGAVRAFAVRADELIVVDQFKAYALITPDNARTLVDGFVDLTSVVMGPSGQMWLGDGEEALVEVDVPGSGAGSVLRTGVTPDGPFVGQFTDLDTAPDGSLWAGSTAGFFRLSSEGSWTNYMRDFFEELEGGSGFRLIHVDAQGNAWAASRGDGVIQVTPEGAITAYGVDNSTLLSTAGASFVPVTGLASEPDGTLWVANREASSPLHVRLPNGTWHALPPPRCDGLIAATTLGPILVDSFGMKWIIVVDQSNFELTRGVLVLDTGPDPADPDDDICRFINQTASQGTGLPSILVNALAEDREGRIWIATERGPAYIISSRVAAQDPSAIPILPQRANFVSGENPFLLNSLPINDIAVDPANRLWVATDGGAYLVEEVAGGFAAGAPLTAETTPLFSNVIIAVHVDPLTGEVFFATDRGLLSRAGDAVAPAPEVADLLVYPNPVRFAGDAAPDIFIDGLVEETEVRILAPHGEVVAQFPARGGRVRWDGRDRNRELVPSGVYLVVAIGQNGEGTAYGKVAVIH